MIGATLYLAGEEISDVLKQSPLLPGQWIELIQAVPCPICMRMIKNAGIKRLVDRGGETCL